MPRITKFKYLTICFIVFFQQLSAQSNFTETIQKQFDQYNSDRYTEKVYLNTDRNFYITGEIIWFKLYITNAINNNLSDLSKIAYTELVDANNRVFLQAKIGITDGLGSGSFFIPASIPSGNYKVRCYTNWMKNFDANFFFETAITIVNTATGSNLPEADTSLSYNIDFFPEGGNLIPSNENNIAFKITNNRGAGENNCTGFITAEKDTITYFNPLHAGIGTFLFTPAKGQVYTAHIINKSGKEITKKTLPAAIENLAIRLTTSSTGQITIKVNSSINSTNNNGELYLFVHTKGVIKSIQKAMLQSGSAQFIVDESKLGEGISHFTLFDSQHKPVCERLYFKRPADVLKIEVNPDAEQYAIRKKSTVSIRAINKKNNPLRANMSVSIYRIDSLQRNSTTDIFSSTWLGSELNGTIENAAYYFTDVTETTTKALDNLMLTHGWRRFRWDDVQSNKKTFFEFLPEFEGHIITGKIIDTFSKKPFIENAVYASVAGQYTQFYTSQPDKNGNIKFYTKNLVGPSELIVQAQEPSGISNNIEIHTPFSAKFSSAKTPYYTISPELKPALETNSINAQIQRRYAAELLRKYYLPDIDTSTFYGRADERYLLDDYTRFTTMEEVLREYVLGVIVGRSNKKFKLTVFDVQNKRLFKDNPLLLLDGAPVQDADRIMKYDPLKVKKIEVVTRRYYYGPLVIDGIVNFVTYKGNMEELEMDPKSVVLDFEGIQLQREFYMPAYATEEQRSSHLADFRNLLYWQPYVITGINGETQVDFYTSDLKGKFLGVIEGMTKDGTAGSNTFSFEVQ